MFEFVFNFDDEAEDEVSKLKAQKDEDFKDAREINLFEKCSGNHRPNLEVFMDWIGYAMFVQGGKFEKLPKEKQEVYQEVWKECIRPMYKEFME